MPIRARKKHVLFTGSIILLTNMSKDEYSFLPKIGKGDSSVLRNRIQGLLGG